MRPSSVDSQVCKNSSNRSSPGIIQWTTNKPPKPTHSVHYRSLDPIQIHWSIIWIFFASTSVRFWDTLVGELPSYTYSFPLHLIMNLDFALVGTTCMLEESASMSKNLPSTNVNKKIVGCSTSTGCSVSFSTFVVFFSTYSSSLKSFIMTNVSARSEKCLWRPYNVSSSPPTVATHFNAPKKIRSTSHPSPELSLLSWNIGGGIDVSSLM